LETVIEIAAVTFLVVVVPDDAVDDLKSNAQAFNPKVSIFVATVAVIVGTCL
jgi:hypothetical protein